MGKDIDQKPSGVARNGRLPLLGMLNLDHSMQLLPSEIALQDGSLRGTLTARADQTKEQKMSALLHSKSTKDAGSRTDQPTNKRNVILEHVIVRNGQSLDTVVIKEPFKDRYSIFAIDFLSGQRYELHFSSEDVQNLLENDMLVTSIHDKNVWTAVLDKVTLEPVQKFSKVISRNNPSVLTEVLEVDGKKSSDKDQKVFESVDWADESCIDGSRFFDRNLPVNSSAHRPSNQKSNNHNNNNHNNNKSGTVANSRAASRLSNRRDKDTVSGCTSPVDFSDYILTLQSLESSFEDNLTVCDGNSHGAEDHDYDFEFDSFEASDDFHQSEPTRARNSSVSSKSRGKTEDVKPIQFYPQHCVERDIADAYHSHCDDFNPINMVRIRCRNSSLLLCYDQSPCQ